MSEEDADYAIKILNMIKLYGKPIKVNKASAQEKNMDVGANIFVGNLDSEVVFSFFYCYVYFRLMRSSYSTLSAHLE